MSWTMITSKLSSFSRHTHTPGIRSTWDFRSMTAYWSTTTSRTLQRSGCQPRSGRTLIRSCRTARPLQREMISDLERNKPPYLALDSEFDKVHEPNGSSVHTGVHLLDDYIAQHYRLVKTFGEMTVLQRIPDTLTGE